MRVKDLKEIQDNETTRKRLAKLMALCCFRNTKLENFHADPDSRLSDEEMKELMIDVVNHCYDFINYLSGSMGDSVIETLKDRDPVPEWNEPVTSRLYPNLPLDFLQPSKK